MSSRQGYLKAIITMRYLMASSHFWKRKRLLRYMNSVYARKTIRFTQICVGRLRFILSNDTRRQQNFLVWAVKSWSASGPGGQKVITGPWLQGIKKVKYYYSSKLRWISSNAESSIVLSSAVMITCSSCILDLGMLCMRILPCFVVFSYVTMCCVQCAWFFFVGIFICLPCRWAMGSWKEC
jgi:hypothetical protein